MFLVPSKLENKRPRHKRAVPKYPFSEYNSHFHIPNNNFEIWIAIKWLTPHNNYPRNEDAFNKDNKSFKSFTRSTNIPFILQTPTSENTIPLLQSTIQIPRRAQWSTSKIVIHKWMNELMNEWMNELRMTSVRGMVGVVGDSEYGGLTRSGDGWTGGWRDKGYPLINGSVR